MSTRSTINIHGGEGSSAMEAIRLCRHMDGDPPSNLATIARAIRAAGDAGRADSARGLALAFIASRYETVEWDLPVDVVLRSVEGPLRSKVDGILREAELAEQAPGGGPRERRLAWLAHWEPGLEAGLRIAPIAWGDAPAEPESDLGPEDLAQLPFSDKLSLELLGSQGDLEWTYVVDAGMRTVDVYGWAGSFVDAVELIAAGRVDPMAGCGDPDAAFSNADAAATIDALLDLQSMGWSVNCGSRSIERECQGEIRRSRELGEIAESLPAGKAAVWAREAGPGPLEGPLLVVGERYALQRVLKKEGFAFVVHDKLDLMADSLAEGMRYQIAYAADGAGFAEPSSRAKSRFDGLSP